VGIYNRDYIRELHSNSGGWGGWAPVVKYIIIANVAVFLLQIVVVRDVKSPLEQMRNMYPELDRFLTRHENDGDDPLDALQKEHPDLYKSLTEDARDSLLSAPTPKVSVIQDWLELDTRKVVRGGQVWRLVTSAFCHSRHDIWHIVFNM
jgi:membrane associated rhomboid family serine protease